MLKELVELLVVLDPIMFTVTIMKRDRHTVG
jgi:hypothetical protein